MEPIDLSTLVQAGPCRVKMNNGDAWEIPSPEFCLVGEYTAAILHRDDDGVMRNKLISLMNICSGEPING